MSSPPSLTGYTVTIITLIAAVKKWSQLRAFSDLQFIHCGPVCKLWFLLAQKYPSKWKCITTNHLQRSHPDQVNEWTVGRKLQAEHFSTWTLLLLSQAVSAECGLESCCWNWSPQMVPLLFSMEDTMSMISKKNRTVLHSAKAGRSVFFIIFFFAY